MEPIRQLYGYFQKPPVLCLLRPHACLCVRHGFHPVPDRVGSGAAAELARTAGKPALSHAAVPPVDRPVAGRRGGVDVYVSASVWRHQLRSALTKRQSARRHSYSHAGCDFRGCVEANAADDDYAAQRVADGAGKPAGSRRN